MKPDQRNDAQAVSSENQPDHAGTVDTNQSVGTTFGQVPEGQTYISNPFQVFIDSFRRLFTVNFTTFLAFVGVVLLTIGAMVMLAVIVGISGDALESGFSTAVTIFGFLLAPVVLVWTFILKAAWEKYVIETAREQETSFGIALRIGLRKVLGYIGLHILVWVAVTIGLVLLIVPGLIFLYWFIFAPLIYVDKDIGVIAALKQSKRLVKGKLVELIGLVGAGMVFGLPAGLPLIGMLYQLILNPVSNLSLAYRYTSADMLDQAGLPKPETHVANTVMAWILVALLGLLLVTGLILAFIV